MNCCLGLCLRWGNRECFSAELFHFQGLKKLHFPCDRWGRETDFSPTSLLSPASEDAQHTSSKPQCQPGRPVYEVSSTMSFFFLLCYLCSSCFTDLEAISSSHPHAWRTCSASPPSMSLLGPLLPARTAPSSNSPIYKSLISHNFD